MKVSPNEISNCSDENEELSHNPRNSPTGHHSKRTKKQILKRKRNKFPNDDVSNERRQALLELILKTNSIRQAANQLNINNSTAKSIYYKYK